MYNINLVTSSESSDIPDKELKISELFTKKVKKWKSAVTSSGYQVSKDYKKKGK